MAKNKINELRAQRAKTWESAKAFLDSHRNDKGILSAEDTHTYEQMEQEIVDLGHEIERQERLDAMEREMALPVNTPITGKPQNPNAEEKTGRAMEGRPFGRVAYGYYNAGENQWAVQEEEAERVRTAFQMAARGCKYPEILFALNNLELRDGTGVIWKQKRLRYLLQNVVYKGDYYSHGTVCLVPGRQVENKGYRDRFYIEEHHAPIVSAALFDRVQEILKRGLLISYRPLSPDEEALLLKLA